MFKHSIYQVCNKNIGKLTTHTKHRPCRLPGPDGGGKLADGQSHVERD
jgi:hypothetical protein